PGFGCFSNPLSQIGTPLDFTFNHTLPITLETACTPGFFCPYLDLSDNSTFPVACPAGDICFLTRATGKNCNIPQGLFEPMICPPGFFCPDYKTVTVCPVGHYCLSGSSSPKPCIFMSTCPAGTIVQLHYGLLLISFVIDFVLAVVFCWIRYHEHTLANPNTPLLSLNRPSKTAPPSPTTTLFDSSLPVKFDSAVGATMEENISALTQSYHKSLHGQDGLQMNYEFEGLGLTLAGGKEILKGVSGEIRAGRMTAIMGPSGAGKTTFMNVLMGRVARTSGTLKINDTVSEMHTFKKIIGYVPQEDVMIEELTVRENIRYSARTRLPNSWTNKEVEEHVDAILMALNLSHVAHKRIGNVLERGISGGQRKRVNIGMELAAAPLSVFLDEPTSGLDSTAAMDSVNILSSISRLGLTIVAVIHQPRIEIFESFDDVLMIAPGGRTAYFGPVSSAKSYFESLGFAFPASTNVADTLMDILAGRGKLQHVNISPSILQADTIVQRWAPQAPALESKQITSFSSTEQLHEIANDRGASFIRQIVLSHNRSMTQQVRLVSGFVMEVLVGLCCGGIMGLAASSATGGGEIAVGLLVVPYTALSAAPTYWFLGLFGLMVGLSICLAAATPGVKVFSEEQAVYIREVSAGHNRFAYFLGKNISTLYRTALSAAHFVGLNYLLAQPPLALGDIYLLIFLNFFAVYGLGMMVAMVARRENAPILAVTLALFAEGLCGFGPTLSQAADGGFSFVMDVGVNRWMAEAQFTLWMDPYAQVYAEEYSHQAFGYTFGQSVKDMLIMFAIGLAYRLAALGLFLVVLEKAAIQNMWANWRNGGKKRG
ncbi:hypothetical protein HDU98_011047, partial [Podochytrium sp. JEL0797]